MKQLQVQNNDIRAGVSARYSRGVIVAFISLVVLMYEDFLVRTTGINSISYAGHAVVIFSFLFFLLHGIKSGRVHKVIVLWSMVVALLSFTSVLSPYSSNYVVSIVSAVLFAKIFLIFYLGYKVELLSLNKIIRWLAIVHVAGFVFNVISPSYFQGLLPHVSFDLDVSRTIGFEVNANRFAAGSVVLALYFWFIERKRLIFLVLIVSLLMAGSRSLIALFIVSFIYFSWMSGLIRKNAIVAFSVAGIFLVFLAMFAGINEDLNKIENTVNGDSRYIRAAMLVGGWELAEEYKPFGTGGGTFGSPLSRGSQVYEKIGISDWATVEDGAGIHDSGVGSLLGEYGFFGVLVLLFSLFMMFKVMGRGSLSMMDITFLMMAVVGLSFFRGVVSSYYYSVIIFILFIINVQIRKKAFVQV